MDTSNSSGLLKEELLKVKKMPITHILSFLFFTATFSMVIYYICWPSEGFWHSDCTDSLYWANATVESGMTIADNYRYAAILPFSANIWMVPLIKMFGFTVKTQIISMVIFAVLYVASQIWLFRSMKFTWPMTFTATASMLMLLSSSAKMREIMWEHVIYYSLAILLFNCLLALSFNVIHAHEKYIKTDKISYLVITLIMFVFLCLLSLGASTNCFTLIIMTTAPVSLGIAAEMIFERKNKLLTAGNGGRFLTLVGIPAFTVFGLKVLDILKGDVVADYTNFYSKFAPLKNWSENLFKFPIHFLTLIGFTDNSAELTEKEGIANFIILCVFIVLVLTPIISLFFYNKFKHRETRIALLSYLFLFAAIMFVFICGNISNVNWRLTPIVGISAIAVFAVINEMLEYHRENNTSEEETAEKGSQVPLRFASLLVALLFVFSFINYKELSEIPADYGRDNTVHQLTKVLMGHDLEYGYATFWRSQAITLLSDNTVKCREILANSRDGAKTDYYQSSYDWYEPQEGVEKYFVLLSEGEYVSVSENSTWQRWIAEQLIETIEYNNFYIFVFNGYLEGIK